MKKVMGWLPAIVIGLSSLAIGSPEKISLHKFTGSYKATSCHSSGGPATFQDLDAIKVKVAEQGFSSVSMRPKNSLSDWVVQFDPEMAIHTEPTQPHVIAIKKRYTFKADENQFAVDFTVCGLSSLFTYSSTFTCQKTSEEGVSLRTEPKTPGRFQLTAFQKNVDTNGKKFTIKCELTKDFKEPELSRKRVEAAL